VPKKLVLNLYCSWCQSNRQALFVDQMNLIQMALTNDLKAIFPRIDAYSKYYRGLRFWREADLDLSYTQAATITEQRLEYAHGPQ
jgi:hypothetical protein